MKRKITFLLSALFALTLITQPTKLWAQNTYKLVTNANQLSANDEIIIASGTSGDCYAIGAAGGTNYRKRTEVSVTTNGSLKTITTEVDNGNETTSGANTANNNLTNPLEITLVSSNTYWQLKEVVSNGNIFLNGGYKNSNNKNQNVLKAANSANTSTGTNQSNGVWSITISNNVATIKNQNNFSIKHNNSDTRFASYTSGQQDVYIYKKAYSVSYNANGGTGTMTDSNSPYFMNSTVTTKTNTFENGGQTFTGWNTKANGSGTSYAEGETFSITENTTLYAQWASATTVATPSIYLDGGTYMGNQSTTISCVTAGASIYYTLDGTDPSSTNGTLYSDEITIDHSCTLKAIGIKGGLTNSPIVSATYTIKVNTPTFTPNGGNLYQTTSVTINCETEGASIYYTMGADPADPTSSSTPYTGAISVSSATKIKAIAIKSGSTDSEVATATFTFPTVITISALRAYDGSDAKYTRGVVTYIADGKTAYIQDATAAIAIYKNDNDFTSGLSVGDEIVVSGKKKTYYGLLEIGTEATIEAKLSTGNTVSPTVKTVAAINTDYGSGSGDNNFQSMFVKIEKATYNGSNSVTQSGSSITVEGTMGDAVNGDAVTFTGIIGCYDGVKIINLGNVEIVNDPTILAAESLTVPSYVQETPVANITAGSLSVSGSNLSADITCTLDENSKFELYNGSEWTNTTTIAQISGSASGNLQIRLKSGQSYNASAYTGSVTLSSTGVDDVVVSLSGSVTYVHVTYNGNADGVTNVPTDATNYTYNQQVTVLGEGSMTRTGYDFVKWNTESDGTGQDYVENGTFNITEDVTLYAQWAAKSYSITADPAITNGSISFTVGGAAATTAQTGQTVTIVSTPATGYGLSSVSVNSGAVTVTNNTFVMPAGDVTVSATFVVMVTDALTPTSIGVYSSAYTAWTDKTWSSDAVYDGKTSGGDNYASKIQLRVKDKNEGIITTATGGKIKKVVVTWNSSSSSGNTLNVYGMNSSYSAVTDLYNQNLYGSLIGQIVCGTSTELIITNDTVTSIGLRSDDGTIYLDEIDIIWDPIKYTVTYDANGGSGSMSDPNSPYTSNSTVTVLSNSFTGPVVSEVTQEFARWNTKADGSGTNYNPGATFSMPKENVTLYAQWIAPCTEKATMDDVVLNAAYVPGENRIKLEMLSDVAVLGGCDITDYGFVYSTSVANPTIGADNCTKIVVGNEYTSAGDDIEYTMDNATLGATYYVRSYAINNAGTAYSAVESVMIASSYPTYTITYSTNGNSDGSSTINQGNAIGTLPTPTESYIPDGYEFVGWYNGDSYSNATAPTVVKATDVPDNNMNLKAMFAISPSGGEQYLEITIGNFSEITTSYTTTFTHEYPEATITAYGVYKNSNGIQMNSGKGTYIKNTTAMPGAITKFELTWTSTGNNSPTMYANTNSVASTSSTSLGKQSNSVTTQTINTTVSDGYRYFYFDGTTVTGACYLSSFKIYYLDLYYTTSATVPSGDYWHVNGSGVLTDNTTIPAGSYTFTSPITVPNGKTLTVNGYLGTSSANLIIEEGGQLIIPNDATVAATFRKEMPEAPADKDRVTVTGWKLISSPTTTPGQAYESFESVTYLTASGYLLYNYDEENRIWRSSQTTGHTYSTLNVGQGYLYGNSTGTAIEFTGNVNSAASYSIDLSYNEKDSDNLAGFNLIGNPFSHEIAWSNGVTLTGESISNGYYKIDGEGFSATLCTENIAPLQGILVKANATDQSVTFNNVMPLAKGEQANHDNIMFKVENSECSDVAYALFDKGYGLNKISHRGDMVPMLYIPQNGENYAIAMMDDNTKTFNLGFEAKTTAKYTLTYKAKGEFNYLHVIDRMTGEDIDMLLEGEYSFVGSPQDDNNRFIVRLGYLPNYDDNGEDTFAYQNGSDIVVSGEGELQIFDVMGRKVASITINGVETVNIPTQGVYIMKLNEKTQKIVVR